MPVASPDDEALAPVLRRVHVHEMERMIQEIIANGGFGEIKLRMKKSKVYSLAFEVEILVIEGGISQRDK